MSDERERYAPAPVVDRTALAGMAGEAAKALAALRPGGKPPPRRTATGKETCEISVRLKVVTPILGGGPRLRDVDRVDVIRVPTVRGHLRFWWRALYGHEYGRAEELYEAESALWGRPAEEHGGRSEVEVTIPSCSQHHDQDIDDSNPLNQRASYALWPARVQGAQNTGHLPRRRPGAVTFTLRIVGPKSSERILQNTIRAWILFGGYGSRTRRGLGSLTVEGGPRELRFWLPDVDAYDDADKIHAQIKSRFGFCPFAQRPARSRKYDTTPVLAGASLFMHLPEEIGTDAASAWQTSLTWLNQFRQMRRPAGRVEPNRPSVSLWPEPDKIRRALTATLLRPGDNWAHTPVHNGTPAWPRGGFGLPIVGKFQDRSRDRRQRKDRNGNPLYDRNNRALEENVPWPELPAGHPNKGIEPKDFELRWRSDFGDPRKNGEHERLASPLILKPFPLANGKFIACAIWLDRQMPPNARIFLVQAPTQEAPFDRLVAPGDAARFTALGGKSSLRNAFCDWLVTPEGRDPARAVRIAP